MKKASRKAYRMIFILVVFLLSGCGSSSKEGVETPVEAEEKVENKTEDASIESWKKVDAAFDKLSKTKNINIVGKIACTSRIMGDEKGGFDAVLVQQNEVSTILNDAVLSKKSEISRSIGNTYSYEDKNIFLVGDSSNHQNATIDNIIAVPTIEEMKEFSDVYLYRETNETINSYFDKFQSGDNTRFAIGGRGGEVRFIRNKYFDAKTESTEEGELITFFINEKSSKFDDFNNEGKNELVYDTNVLTIDVCDKDDQGANLIPDEEVNGEYAGKYVCPVYIDKLVEAKIEIQLDNEGYPISYKRISIMNYDTFNFDLPYFAYYTFQRS